MRKYIPWLVGIAIVLVYFAVFETLAFTAPATHASLSNFISTLGQWPLFIFLCGQLCGVLSAHFFWPWRDNPLGKGGG